MNKIEHVDIIFENCDVCSIPVEENSDLLNFQMYGITENAISITFSKEFNTYKSAEEVYLTFSKEALDIKSHWGIFGNTGNTLRQQLNFRDIVGILIYYNTDIEYYVSVVYDEENKADLGSPNINQVNEMQPNGSCRVSIKRKSFDD